MHTEVRRLYELNIEIVAFVKRCRSQEFLNNGSLAATKWHWFLSNGDEWYATGDIVQFNDAGFMYYLGRNDVA